MVWPQERDSVDSRQSSKVVRIELCLESRYYNIVGIVPCVSNTLVDQTR
jgi:hypothetical protein